MYRKKEPVSYCTQPLLLKTQATVIEALHRINVDQQTSLKNVGRIARSEEQTFRAKIALHENSTSSPRQSQKIFMYIEDPLRCGHGKYISGHDSLVKCNLGPLFLLVSENSDLNISLHASFMTADNRIDTLEITGETARSYFLSTHLTHQRSKEAKR